MEFYIKLKANKEKENLEKTEIKLKNLVKGKVKEDIWTLNGDSIINVRYNIFDDNPKAEIKRKSIYNPKLLNIGLVEMPPIENEIKEKELPQPINLGSPKKPKFKKLSFNVPNSFKERENKKMATSKLSLQMDNLRSKILTRKETNKVELDNKASPRTKISTMQLTRLDYELKDMDDSELGFLESFVDYFFICGVPKRNCKSIPESDYLEPVCKHKNCGLLKSYRPDILHRYPAVNNKIFNLCNSVNIF